jgi:hypothetical protein
MTSPYYLSGLKQEREELSEIVESLERRQRRQGECERLRMRLGTCRRQIGEADRLIAMLEIKLRQDQTEH